MERTVPFCETPGQSVAIGVFSGVIGGVLGLLLGFGLGSVVAVACLLAVVGDIGAHAVRRDAQFREAIAQLRGSGR